MSYLLRLYKLESRLHRLTELRRELSSMERTPETLSKINRIHVLEANIVSEMEAIKDISEGIVECMF